ncbi:MAG: dihydroneopterin aldolase [Candidatus Poseidoniales archaeon]|nr:MAG: dihydroneopterin aldolase [Candidatus Poseidoniales archaeon]
MVTRIGLESYEIMACHGAYDFERERNQPFVISIWATLISDVESDDLDLTLNYADLQSAVDSEIVNSKPVKLMETLCKKLVDKISSNEIVQSISIRMEKPDAPFPHPGGLAVVEHEWTRD